MANQKLELIPTLTEGCQLGIKNFVSLLLTVILYGLTVWIPWLNVGTTIGLYRIIIDMTKGKIINPTSIFDKKNFDNLGNFFLLGLSVQKAVKNEETRAKEILRASHALRYALMVILVLIAILIPSVFNMWATLISLLFATIAVYTRAIFNKDKKTGTASAPAAADNADNGGNGEE